MCEEMRGMIFWAVATTPSPVPRSAAAAESALSNTPAGPQAAWQILPLECPPPPDPASGCGGVGLAGGALCSPPPKKL